MRTWLIVTLLVLATGLFEATTRTLLPSPFNALRPVLDAAVLLTVIHKRREAITVALAAGFILDVYALGGHSWQATRLPIVIALVGVIYETVLTNRSVYTALALVLIARFMDGALTWLVAVFAELLFHSAAQIGSWSALAWTVAWDAVILVTAFLAVALLTRRLMMASK